MLPLSARLTSPQDFARTTKSGLRVTSEHFVGYLHITPVTNNTHVNNTVTNNSGANGNPRAGLIIGKAVGGSVRRHRVSRQIRHALAAELSKFPQGSLIVIRGLKQNSTVNVQAEIAELSARLISKAAKRMATA